MISKEDVYIAFRKAQSQYNSRPYRLPKNFDNFYNKKLSEKTRKYIEHLTNNFNTKWRHIDIDRYFRYGFELFGKNFTYIKFLDRKILRFYIERDKALKRAMVLSEKEIIESFQYIRKYIDNLPESRLSPILQYCLSKDEGQVSPINHYIKGKVNKYIIIWLCKNSYLKLSDTDRVLVPLIVEKWRDYLDEIIEWGIDKKIYRIANMCKLLE